MKKDRSLNMLKSALPIDHEFGLLGYPVDQPIWMKYSLWSISRVDLAGRSRCEVKL